MSENKEILEERGKIPKSQLQDSVEFGATRDTIDIKTLGKWTTIMVIFLTALILFGTNLYSYYSYEIKMETAINANYKDLNKLQEESQKRLSSYGVVDDEAGVYHIPLDEAIQKVEDKYSN
jgi:hypothetical protein